MAEAKCAQKSRWFRAARAVGKGRALEVLDAYIMNVFGKEEEYLGMLNDRPDDSMWESHWQQFEAKLKQAAGLDDTSELNDAVREYGKVRLEPGATPKKTEEFLNE